MGGVASVEETGTCAQTPQASKHPTKHLNHPWRVITQVVAGPHLVNRPTR